MEVQESVYSYVSESCRLCLNKTGMFNIFKIKGLIQDILDFTGVKVFLAPKLPQLICGECLVIINSMKQLRAVAVKNDFHMRTLVNNKLNVCTPVTIEQFIVEKVTQSDVSKDNVSFYDNLETYYIKAEEITIEEHHGPCPNGKEYDSSVNKIIVRTDLSEPPQDTQHKKCALQNMSSSKNLKQPEPPFICEVCDKDFSTWKKFYYHNRLHNKSVPCTFKGCQKKFASKGDLMKHLRTHTGEKPYQCDMCLRRFTQKVTLKNHIESVHYDDNTSET